MKRILIVHGHENYEERLSQDAKARCRLADNMAYSYGYPEGPLPPYDESPISEIIFSGGLFSKSQNGITNSQAMKKYLELIRLNCFKDAARPLLKEESESLTTIDNVERVIPMLDPNDEIHVISSDYHSWRVRLIWQIIAKQPIIFHSAKSPKISAKKLAVELVGIIITGLYYLGFKAPELYMRKQRTKIFN